MAPSTPAVSSKIKFIVKVLAPLQPGESPPSTPSRTSTKPLATLSIAANAGDKFSEVSKRILEVWKQNYGSHKTDESYFVKLQGIHGEDINLPDPVGDLYTPSMPQGERMLYVVTHALDRDCTIPPWSRLRLEDQAQRKHTLEEEERLDRRKRQRVRYGTTVDDLSPDEPLETREDVNRREGEECEDEEHEGEAGAEERSPPATPRRVRPEPATQESILVEDSQATQEQTTVAATTNASTGQQMSPRPTGRLRNPAAASTTPQWDLTNGRGVSTAGLEMRGLATTSAERLARRRRELPTPITPEDPISSYDPPESGQRPNRRQPFGQRPARAFTEHQELVSNESDMLMDDPIDDDDLLNALENTLPQQTNSAEESHTPAGLPNPGTAMPSSDHDLPTTAGRIAPCSNPCLPVRSSNAFDIMRSSQSTSSSRHQAEPSSTRWSDEENRKLIEGSLAGLPMKVILKKYGIKRSDSAARNHRLLLEKHDPTLTDAERQGLKALRLRALRKGSTFRSSPSVGSRSSPAIPQAAVSSISRPGAGLMAPDRTTSTSEQVEPEIVSREATVIASTDVLEVSTDTSSSEDTATRSSPAIRPAAVSSISRPVAGSIAPDRTTSTSEQAEAEIVSQEATAIASTDALEVSMDGTSSEDTTMLEPEENQDRRSPEVVIESSEQDRAVDSYVRDNDSSNDIAEPPSATSSLIRDTNGDGQTTLNFPRDKQKGALRPDRESTAELDARYGRTSSRNSAARSGSASNEASRVAEETGAIAADPMQISSDDQEEDDDNDSLYTSSVAPRSDVAGTILDGTSINEPGQPQASAGDEEVSGNGAEDVTQLDGVRDDIATEQVSDAAAVTATDTAINGDQETTPRPSRPNASAMGHSSAGQVAAAARSNVRRVVTQRTPLTASVRHSRPDPYNFEASHRRRQTQAAQVDSTPEPTLTYNERMSIARGTSARAGRNNNINRDTSIASRQSTPEIEITRASGDTSVERPPRRRPPTAQELIAEGGPGMIPAGQPGVFDRTEEVIYKETFRSMGAGASREAVQAAFEDALHNNRMLSAIGRGDHAEVERLRQRKAQMDREAGRSSRAHAQASSSARVVDGEESADEEIVRDDAAPGRVSLPDDDVEQQTSSEDDSDQEASEDEEADDDASEVNIDEPDIGEEKAADTEQSVVDRETDQQPREEAAVGEMSEDENDEFQSAVSSPMPVDDEEDEDFELPTHPPPADLQAQTYNHEVVTDADLQQLENSGDERDEDDAAIAHVEEPESDPAAPQDSLPAKTEDRADTRPSTAAAPEAKMVNGLGSTTSNPMPNAAHGNTEGVQVDVKVRKKKKSKKERGYRKKTTKSHQSETACLPPDANGQAEPPGEGQPTHLARTESSASFRSSTVDDKRRRRRRMNAVSAHHASSPAVRRPGTPTAPAVEEHGSAQPNPQMPTPGLHQTGQVVMSVATPPTAADNNLASCEREKTLKERLTFTAHIPSPPRARTNGTGPAQATVKPGVSLFSGATDDEEDSESSESSDD